jgi:molecular chaperone GrpE
MAEKEPAAAEEAAAPPAAAEPAANARTDGRSAEARELERQLDDLREQLRQAEQRSQENLDRWQRAQADLANYRRRAHFERDEMEKFAVAGLVAGLLPVLDNFDRAWQSLPGQFRHLTWLSGIALIHSQLRATLERVGLAEIEAEGRPFDASVHEAVDREDGDGPPHVVAVLQAGYKLHERVLRPALVKAGPAPAPEREESGDERQGAATASAVASTPGGEQPATDDSAPSEAGTSQGS